jgi:D-alanine-D-alanine ligase
VESTTAREAVADRLHGLDRELKAQAEHLAVFLVYDRPERVAERPGLEKTYFAERCVSDAQLDQTIVAFRSVGAYVELFEGEQPFLAALTSGGFKRLERPMKVVYNGIGWGVAVDGFQRGRKALLPAVADSYGLVCANSDAYACAFTLHKFHSFAVLRAVGIPTPPVWHYSLGGGWVGEAPPDGKKVIVKSTYEAWSVGVSTDSVFVVDGPSAGARAGRIAQEIGQSVTVQEFVSGPEVCVTVLASPERLVLPPVEVVLNRAEGSPDAVMTLEDNLRRRGVLYRPFAAPESTLVRLRRVALETIDVLELQGLTRMDFRVDADGRPWLIDVAISPGVSEGSSAVCAARCLGIEHPAFLRAVVAASLRSHGRLQSA